MTDRDTHRRFALTAAAFAVVGALFVLWLPAIAQPQAPSPDAGAIDAALAEDRSAIALTAPDGVRPPAQVAPDSLGGGKSPTATAPEMDSAELAHKSGALWLAGLLAAYSLGVAFLRSKIAPSKIAAGAGGVMTAGAVIDAAAASGSIVAILVSMIGAWLLTRRPDTGIGTSPAAQP